MIAASKVRHPTGYLKLLQGVKAKDLVPEAPGIAEFSTGETMGHSADRLVTKFGVTRREQDEYALRSHQMAAKAWKDGVLADQIVNVNYPKSVTTDNGVRGESTMEKLSSVGVPPPTLSNSFRPLPTSPFFCVVSVFACVLPL
jgi:acetyl-CoA acyltransferase